MESELEFLKSIKFSEEFHLYNELMECSECRKTETLVAQRMKLLKLTQSEPETNTIINYGVDYPKQEEIDKALKELPVTICPLDTQQNKTSEKDNLNDLNRKESLGGSRTDGSEDLDKPAENQRCCGKEFIIGKVRGREFKSICGEYDSESEETYLCEKCRETDNHDTKYAQKENAHANHSPTSPETKEDGVVTPDSGVSSPLVSGDANTQQVDTEIVSHGQGSNALQKEQPRADRIKTSSAGYRKGCGYIDFFTETLDEPYKCGEHNNYIEGIYYCRECTANHDKAKLEDEDEL